MSAEVFTCMNVFGNAPGAEALYWCNLCIISLHRSCERGVPECRNGVKSFWSAKHIQQSLKRSTSQFDPTPCFTCTQFLKSRGNYLQRNVVWMWRRFRYYDVRAYDCIVSVLSNRRNARHDLCVFMSCIKTLHLKWDTSNISSSAGAFIL